MEAQGGIRCSSCGHVNRPHRRYCAGCGTDLGEACAACGTRNDPGEKFCGACGTGLTGTATEGERRQLTVLFCDLVGSTAIAVQLDPEDWREVAVDYQRAAAEAVTRFGGHVAKYLGDGLLVYFGYPQAHEDDPERAVRAGLALLEIVAELNQRLESIHGVRLAVRVGMHTGPVVIGEVTGAGAEVFGDIPNVAARLQALADPDSVLITEATQRLVAGRFIVEAKGAPALKGVRTPVAVYRVVQASGVRSRLQAAGLRGLTPFVGREMRRGVAMARAVGSEVAWPLYYAVMAEAHGRLRQWEQGFAALETGVAVARKNGEGWVDAELERVRGSLTLGAPGARPNAEAEHAAERCFEAARATAQRQDAKAFELRAVMALSRLWQRQGKKAAARRLLRDTYAWFTEGFDTHDLVEAKALLDALT